jgi:predicted membrane metal-binding protein
MTPKNYNAQLTNPWRLLFLAISSVGIFIVAYLILKIFVPSLFGLISSILVAIVYFIFLKKRLIQKNKLGISKTQIFLKNEQIAFKDIEKYKIHRMRGAGLKIKIKKGKMIRLSSNDNFCDSDEFVRFVNDFENQVSEIPEIRKVKSFGESRFGLYFAITSTVLFVGVIIYKRIINEEFEYSNLGTMLVALSTMWSGIEIKKTFANKK